MPNQEKSFHYAKQSTPKNLRYKKRFKIQGQESLNFYA